MFLFLLSLLSPMVYAEDIPEIVIEAHREYELYVAPVKFHVYDSSIEVVLPHNIVHIHASKHAQSAIVQEQKYGTWEPITSHGGFKVYNNETIKYAWENCNYDKDHRKCAWQNSHYFLETDITVDRNELTISLSLYNSDMQIIASSVTTNKKIVTWIKQQSRTIQRRRVPNQVSQLGGNCSGNSCTPNRGGSYVEESIIHQPKEEKPLKLEIPHALSQELIEKGSLQLWIRRKID